MIKRNSIISSTLTLYLCGYLCVLGWAFLGKYQISSFLPAAESAGLLILGNLGLGFFLTVSIITYFRKVKTDRLYTKKSNGRYKTTQGILPEGIQHKSETVWKSSDLPPNLSTWIEINKDKHPEYVGLFRKVAGVLKYNLNLPASQNNSVSLYAHSIKVSEELCKLINLPSNEIIKTLFGTCSPSSVNTYLEMIDTLKNVPLLPVLGVSHDIGKLESIEYDGDQIKYADLFCKQSKNIVSRMKIGWTIPDDYQYALLFALNYFDGSSLLPKQIVGDKLQSKSILGEFLIDLLILAHNTVDSSEYYQSRFTNRKIDTNVIIEESSNELTVEDPAVVAIEPEVKAKLISEIPIERPKRQTRANHKPVPKVSSGQLTDKFSKNGTQREQVNKHWSKQAIIEDWHSGDYREPK